MLKTDLFKPIWIKNKVIYEKRLYESILFTYNIHFLINLRLNKQTKKNWKENVLIFQKQFKVILHFWAIVHD